MSELKTVADVIDRLDSFGDNPCTIAVGREDAEVWTYAEMAERCRQLTFGLIAEGLTPGQCVALFATPRPAAFAALCGAMRCGAMVASIDTQMGDEILSGVLSDCQPAWVFTTEEDEPRLRQMLPEETRFIALDGDTPIWELFSAPEAHLPDISPDDNAALFFTSGTTGRPKGVPLTHANLAFQFRTIIDLKLVTPEDRLLLPLPLHHVYPFVIGTLAPFALGMPIVLPYALTGPEIVRSLHVGEVTVMAGVPRLYRALDEAIAGQINQKALPIRWLMRSMLSFSKTVRKRLGWRIGRKLFRPLHRRFGPHLRLLACGGAPLGDTLAWRLEALGWQVSIGYGLTETSPLISMNLPDALRLGTVGQIVPGVEVRIAPLEADGEEPRSESTGTDEPQLGEVQARGPNIFHGYLNLPDKTQEAFTEDGFFHTGDLGFIDADGYLHLRGRATTMIVTEGGENVQPEDVEEAYAAEPAISEIGVLQRDEKLVAVIVPDGAVNGAGVEQEIQKAVARVSKKLPSYQRVLHYVVQQEALPRTRLGKIQRHKLPERYDRGTGGENGDASRGEGAIAIEDMSSEDQALLESPKAHKVWQWLSQRYEDQRLTPDTNLQLDLGVDSLEWLNLTMEIGQHVGVELGEREIRGVETVRDLLARVAEAAEAGSMDKHPLESPEEVLDDAQLRWIEPLGPWEERISRAAYRWNRALMRKLFRMEIRNREVLESLDRFVLAPNHVSYLDAVVLAAALDDETLERISWAAWVGVAFHNPLARLVSRLARNIPIDPEKGAISSLALAALVMRDEDKQLVLFPEGERSTQGELLPFKPGLGLLLEHYPRPVVPVFIDGTYEAMPVGRAIPKRVPVTVTFGTPVKPQELEGEGEGAAPHQRMMDALHHRVADLIAENQGDRHDS